MVNNTQTTEKNYDRDLFSKFMQQAPVSNYATYLNNKQELISLIVHQEIVNYI